MQFGKALWRLFRVIRENNTDSTNVEYGLMCGPSALTKFPRCDLRDFQNERAVYDTHNDRFPRFARTKGQHSAAVAAAAASAVEMIWTKGNVFIANQASYLLRNCTDNGAEIKHRSGSSRPAGCGYKNAEIMTPFVRTKWTQRTLAHIFLFCVVPRVFYRNKGYVSARRDGKRCLSYILWRAVSASVLKEKNCSQRKGKKISRTASTLSFA